MKIAISGKGGSGKTTLTVSLGKFFYRKGYQVILVDADPALNLGELLGIPEQKKITPLVEFTDLIKERTESEEGSPIFKLNPRVDDIPEKFSLDYQGIKLMVMGSVKKGGAGCICPENAFLRGLLNHLILARKEVVIVDMEAGVEHLGRATAAGVDWFLIVCEPTPPSTSVAFKIEKLARDIGIKRIGIIGNKIEGEPDRGFLRTRLAGFDILGFLPFNKEIKNLTPLNLLEEFLPVLEKIYERMTGGKSG